ncbi:hypothetical protein [Streptomyces sp. C10-9-1]|uniref:hypothetical protein n=1 Tax=Streptomyces sp. C10-9-1 TaxID=1859285 RepID=UPI003F4A1CE6
MDEIRACHERLDHEAVNDCLEFSRMRMEGVIGAYDTEGGQQPVSDDARAMAWKRSAQEAAPVLREMCARSRSFLADQLVPSGLLGTIGIHSDLLWDLARAYPKATLGPAVLEITKARKESWEIEALAQHLDEESRLRRAPTFFSAQQVESDLTGALDRADHLLDSLERHETNWFRVSLGIVRITAGLLGQVAGAITCGTGFGCVLGAVGIASGTDGIISGAGDVADGLEE